MWDSYVSFYANTPNFPMDSPFNLVGMFYDGPVYPRYLYSYSWGPGSFNQQETFTIWHSSDSLSHYYGINALAENNMVNSTNINFKNKIVKFIIQGLKILKKPLLSKMVVSRMNIEIIGEKKISPGFLNQTVPIRDRVKLNNEIEKIYCEYTI